MICRKCNTNTTPSSRWRHCLSCDPRPRCLHCRVMPANRARGLCNRCYLDAPRVRPRTPEADVMGRRPLPKTPTAYAPGTLEKLDVLADRASRREALHHPLDADHRGTGQRINNYPLRSAGALAAAIADAVDKIVDDAWEAVLSDEEDVA